MNNLLWLGFLVGCFVHEAWCQNHFDLCNQNMTSISKETKQIKELPWKRVLSLSLCSNNITTISSDTCLDFPELVKLTLDDNIELKFPKNLVFLESSSLTTLHCIRCGIDQLYNRSLENLPNLEQINLIYNEISIIEPGAFGKNRKLEEVYLMHNKLREIPKEMVEDLHNLCSIDLSHNLNLTPIENQPFLISNGLNELICKNCGFSVIYGQTFSELISLTKLDLRGNKIYQIYEASFSLQINLKELNIQNNSLTMLDRNLFEKGIKICIDGNPDELQCFIQNHKIQTKCSETFQKIVDCPQTTTIKTTKTVSQPKRFSTTPIEYPTLAIVNGKTTSTVVSIFTSTTTIKSTTLEPAHAEMGIFHGYFSVIILVQISVLILVILIVLWLKPKKPTSYREVGYYSENSYYSVV